MSDKDDLLGLADFISLLRTELDLATAAVPDDAKVKFEVGNIEMEVQVMTSRAHEVGGTAKGSWKFWVVNAEVAASAKHSGQLQHTQKLKLTLTPRDAKTGGPVNTALRGQGGSSAATEEQQGAMGEPEEDGDGQAVKPFQATGDAESSQ